MNELEKIDYTLLGLYYQTRDRGMLRIIQAFNENGQSLTIEELRVIKTILENRGFAVFQVEPQGVDYRSQITDNGIAFVESDSFSQPGTPILDLMTTDE